jgi:hypothetical protein
VRQRVYLIQNFTYHAAGIYLEVEEGFVVDDRFYPFVRFKLKSDYS